MQIIIITNYNGIQKKEVIENVSSISHLKNVVAVNFSTANGQKTQFVVLDGYTEILIR